MSHPPLKKVTLNAWERYFAKHGHYKAKAAKAAEYQRVMEGREQMRSNCLSGTLAAHAISRNQTENLFSVNISRSWAAEPM